MLNESGGSAADPEIGLEGDEQLLHRFATTRDQAAREELATRFLPLASSLAARYRDRGESMEDLEQVARLGLLKAIDGYDDTRSNSFGAYATPTILGALASDHGLAFLKERVFPQDYARTLAEWRERFRASWEKILPMGFDERFKKLWEFYLHYCEAGFRAEYIDVRQIIYKA